MSFFDALREPDPLTLRFTPLGLALSTHMRPEASAEFLKSMVSLPIAEQVDQEVRHTLERLQTVFCHGLFDYKLFTAAQDLTFLAIEGALRRRFFLAYGGCVPFIKGAEREELAATSFQDVYRSLRYSQQYSPGKGWRLAGLQRPEHPGFDGSYTALIAWARGEGLLSGQRNRVLMEALVHLRNAVAHPEEYSVTSPVYASMAIRDAIEVSNRLWGEQTPGGRLYPLPATREVMVLVTSPHGTKRTLMRGHQLPDEAEDAGDWQALVLLAVPQDELFGYVPGFETTAHPVELLWGSGALKDAQEAWAAVGDSWHTDTVTGIDRQFFIRYPPESDEPELPRSRPAATVLPTASRAGRWLVIVADHPFAALRHARHAIVRGEPKSGWCSGCQVTSFGLHKSLDRALAGGFDCGRRSGI